MVVNISKKTFKNKVTYIWIGIIILILLLIAFMGKKISYIIYGNRIFSFWGEDALKNIKSYYSQMDMTVVSNKNINTYSVKEWYKEGIGHKLEYMGYNKDVITITTNESTCKIRSKNNKLDYETRHVYGTSNISSFYTFVSIYNLLSKDSCKCNCYKKMYEKEDKVIIEITLCDKEDCCIANKFKNLGVHKLQLTLKRGVPISYTVYDKNKKEYICIVYNIFDLNNEIANNTFAIE